MVYLYGLFFIAGVAGLVCEVALNRMLVLLVGNTVTASAIIVMTFMAGLSLGSFWGSRFFRHRPPSLLPFIILEMAAGLVTFICEKILWMLTHPDLFAEPQKILWPARWISDHTFTWGMPIIPAFLIGATFPAIVLAISGQTIGRRSTRVGYLYAFNTLGAAFGCALAGFLLLPGWGIRTTFFTASGLFLASAGAAMPLQSFLQSSGRNRDTTTVVGRLSVPSSRNHDWNVYFRLTSFAVGWVALSYQILMIRIVVLLFGNQTTVFPLVVTAFLFAIGLSALMGTRLLRQSGRPFGFYFLILITAGFLISLSPIFLTHLPNLTFRWALGRTGFQFLIWTVILLPTLLTGCLLPGAIYLTIHKTRQETTSASGILYACNCGGGIMGAGTTNILLVPWLGTQGTLVLLAVIFLGAGLIGISLRRRHKRRAVMLLAFFSIALLILFNLPQKTQELYVSVITNVEKRPCDIRLFDEGQAVTATVLDCPGDSRRLFLNGVEEVTSRFYHVRLFKTLGLLPIVLHPSEQPLDVLVIAFGAGITTDAVLDTNRINRVDAVDINPAVDKIQALFKPITGDVLAHPKIHFINAEARHFLRHCRKKYSVIVADSTHPAAYDSWMLYTREFYRQIQEHLTPSGIFVQWIPLTISSDFFTIFLNTFTSVFPYSTFWQIPCSDQAFIMALPKPFEFPVRQIQSQLDQIPDEASLAAYELDKAEDLAGFFVMDTRRINELTAHENRINTDLWPFNASRFVHGSSVFNRKIILYDESVISMFPLRTRIMPYVKQSTPAQKEKIRHRQVLADLLQKYYTFKERVFLKRASKLAPASHAVLSCQGKHPIPMP